MNHDSHCRDLLASLSDYVDGELGEQLCLEIERHLAGCVDCRVVVDTLRKTIYLYQTSNDVTVPPDVSQRLYRSLNLEDFRRG